MNRQKHPLQPPTDTTSDGQALFIRRLRRHRITVRTARILILILFLLLWEFCADQGIIDSFIFSSPSRIALCFYEMTVDRSIFLHIGVTLYETIVSFLLVTAIGILAAVLFWCSRSLSEILEPYLVVLNSLPKSALAPLLIVWLGATPTTIIVAGMSVAIFGSIMNLYTSFTTVDKEKIKLIRTLHGNRRHALFKVVLPSSVPAVISNMKVNIGLCLVGVVIGEFLAARSGLGYLIIYSSQVFKMNWLLMSIVLLCIMAMALYAVIGVVEKMYRKRY
ncbi:MAG TPA: ABC transporter permease [Candidatus Mediterraneibacter guildfordensis]|nr:ABC transporter permease [Candidatus Mediterraneibacter guildfordensis]